MVFMRRWTVVLLVAMACRESGPAPRLQVLGSGTPTVVFEAGLGDTGERWLGVVSVLAKTTRTVHYTRLGLGGTTASAPRTSSRIAQELHAALRRDRIRPPYVIVGHSAGGLHALVFAGRYPREVRGVLLIDPTTPTLHRDLPHLQGEAERREMERGLEEYLNAAPGRRAEWQAIRASSDEAEAAEFPRDVPLIVLSATEAPMGSARVKAYWHAEHEKLARRSDSGRMIQVKAGHFIQIEKPDLVIEQIRTLLR